MRRAWRAAAAVAAAAVALVGWGAAGPSGATGTEAALVAPAKVAVALRVPLPERAPPHPAALVVASPAPARAAAPAPRPVPLRAPAPPAVPPELATYLAADATGAAVALYDGPGAPAPTGSLANPQPYGVPLAFRVMAVRGDWLQVALPVRPNQSTAWVRRAEVALRTVPNRVVASVSGRTVTVYAGHSDVVLFQAPIAVGRPGTPTPTGDVFYVDAVRATGNYGGVYGPYQLRVSAFSEVLYSFNGGPGQVAFHGTNSPGLIGSAVSNGCMRMFNDDITRLVGLAPVGTPVRIVP